MSGMITIDREYAFMTALKTIIVCALASYYTLSFSELPHDLHGNTLSRCFLIHIIYIWLRVRDFLVECLYVWKYYGETISETLFTRLQNSNSCFNIIGITYIMSLISQIACIIIISKKIPFTKGCGVFDDHNNACISVRIISVCSMTSLCFLALMMVISLCCVKLSSQRQRQRRRQNMLDGSRPHESRSYRSYTSAPFASSSSSSQSVESASCPSSESIESNESDDSFRFSLIKALESHALSYLPPKILYDENDECVICAEPMTDDAKCNLRCGHVFHLQCINSWKTRQPTCPMCRQPIISIPSVPSNTIITV